MVATMDDSDLIPYYCAACKSFVYLYRAEKIVCPDCENIFLEQVVCMQCEKNEDTKQEDDEDEYERA